MTRDHKTVNGCDKPSREHDIQNKIRIALSEKGFKVFRINVGEGWVGQEIRLQNGDLLLKFPRRFATGTPKGFSDLLVICPNGKAAFIECKAPQGRASPEQKKFLQVMRGMGCRTGIARSVDEAFSIVENSLSR